MNTLILTLVFAVPPSVPIPPSVPDPPPVPVVAEIDPYAALYARIQAGEKLVVYSGVRMPRGTVGAVEVVIPGEEPGIYWCWLRPDGKTAIEQLANTPGAVGNPGMGSRSQDGGHAPGVVSRPKAPGPGGNTTRPEVTDVTSAGGSLPRSPVPVRSGGVMPTGVRVGIPSGTSSGCST